MAVNNASFTLTMASAPGVPLASVFALAFGRGSLPFLGIEILVDVNSMSLITVPSAASMPVPLSIPNNSSLRGLPVTAQGVHLDPNSSLAASRGLTFTIQ